MHDRLLVDAETIYLSADGVSEDRNRPPTIVALTHDGATVDLIDVFAEPTIPCAFEGARRLERGADGTVLVRPAKGAKLPDDFKLTVRYTLRTQSAVFRLRPFSPNKIERL